MILITFRICRESETLSGALAWIEILAQTIANKVEGQHRQRDGKAREISTRAALPEVSIDRALLQSAHPTMARGEERRVPGRIALLPIRTAPAMPKLACTIKG